MSGCTQCKTSIPGCEDCSSDGDQCYECAPGYTLNDEGVCTLPCHIENPYCSECSSEDPSQCEKCSLNMVMTENGCECDVLSYLNEDFRVP